MRRWLRWLSAAVLIALIAAAWLWSTKRSDDPPIVLIVIDTLRADHLGCYGYFRDTTPEIDAFARDGLLFEKAMTPVGTTLPSHVSLFSSTNPLAHGVFGNLGHFHVAVKTGRDFKLMAQMLGEIGYQTAAFVSSPALADFTGLAAGFELYSQGNAGEGLTRNASQNTDRVLEWLEKTDTSKPFFLFVHYVDPHSPYKAPPPFEGMYQPEPRLSLYLRRHGLQPGGREVDITNRYDAEIRYTDTHLGRLLAQLKRTGLYDRAAIVITADHGEGLGQHSWLFHGRIYNEQMLVPLIVHLPGRPELRGRRYPDPASLIDVLPTLIAALRLPVPPASQAQFEGIDLLGPDQRAYVYSERQKIQKRPDPDKSVHYALTSLEWKFFLRPEDGRNQLFHVSTDPAELHDVLADHGDVAESMRAILQAQIDRYQEAGTRLQQGPAQEIPESAKDQLRRLGYDP